MHRAHACQMAHDPTNKLLQHMLAAQYPAASRRHDSTTCILLLQGI
jgi:hypothetical protein